MTAAAAGPRPFPWQEVMALGLGMLRLSPTAFWSMTPRELESVLSAVPGRGGEAPRRDDLAALMHLFPDRCRGNS
ncbi:phage tail assembly chaperone [Nitratireductor sp. ZSWI3]|nr:rcc01693 family protein [Nitratireductor sp. ZSWI3]MCR4265357.1 phage tail assembly chaperone [Nitratireductor sp. ZSWI3]